MPSIHSSRVFSRPVGNVVAGDARTAEAGVQSLQAGGNAVDAAVSAAFAACAAEPVLTGPFGGGFAVVAAPSGRPVAYDFFATMPGLGLSPVQTAAGCEFVNLQVSFGPTTQTFYGGRGAVAVPLFLPGLVHVQAQHGRLPLAVVLAPAVALAEHGVALSAQLAPIVKILTPIVTKTPEARALFAPGGAPLLTGERFVSPGLANLLRHVAQGSAAQLQGGLPTSLGLPHGRITAEDLKVAQVMCHTPLNVDCGACTVVLNPPPSLGGLLVGLGLALLAALPTAIWQNEAATYRHLLACMAVTQIARHSHVDPAALRGAESLAQLAKTFLQANELEKWHAAMAQALKRMPETPHDLSHPLGSTTHVSAIDSNGMACSITTSNGEGCGHVVPGCGVMANNFLGEQDINPAGFHVMPPGSRMTSMMCPTLVLHNGAPILALGTGGSSRIRTALLQVLAHHLLGGRSLQDAVCAPRIHYEGGALFIEREVFGRRLGHTTLASLAAHGDEQVYFDTPNMFFGGVHVAALDGAGVGDPRRGGTRVNAAS